MFGKARGPKVPWGERYRTSKAIARQSFQLLRQHRDLRAFAYLGIVGSMVYMVIVVGGGMLLAFTTGQVEAFADSPSRSVVTGLVALVLMYPAMVFASVCNGAMTYGLYQRMAGVACTPRQAWRASRTRVGTIARFNLVAMLVAGIFQVVGLLLEKLRLVPYLSRIVQTVGMLGWATAAYFVFPVIVVERERKALDAIRTSTAIARQQWGKSVAGIVTLSLALLVPVVLLMLGFFGVITALMALDLPLMTVTVLLGVALALMLVAFLIVAAIQSSAQVCYQVALYRFARTGRISAPFSAATLSDPWKPYQAQ
ncbi:MAG: hypothetical protein HYT80_11095 [Euryarchaeota archaeon]|nr:hypothetical protein [Euryarchaeota archaeon]